MDSSPPAAPEICPVRSHCKQLFTWAGGNGTCRGPFALTPLGDRRRDVRLSVARERRSEAALAVLCFLQESRMVWARRLIGLAVAAVVLSWWWFASAQP